MVKCGLNSIGILTSVSTVNFDMPDSSLSANAINLTSFTDFSQQLVFRPNSPGLETQMDTLNSAQIEAVLAKRLPNCLIVCTLNLDSTLSIDVTGPDSYQFTIVNIDRSLYHGATGINKLIREILEEMVISRQASRRTGSRRLG